MLQSLFFLDKATGHNGNCVTIIVFPLAKQQVIMVALLCHNHCFSFGKQRCCCSQCLFPLAKQDGVKVVVLQSLHFLLQNNVVIIVSVYFLCQSDRA